MIIPSTNSIKYFHKIFSFRRWFNGILMVLQRKFLWFFQDNFRQTFPSNIPIKYSHQIFNHIPITYSHFKGNYLSQAESPPKIPLLGQPGLGENECIFMIATVGLSVDYTVPRKGPGLGQWRWAERGGSPWTFLGKILQSSYLGGETSWWFQHVSNMFLFSAVEMERRFSIPSGKKNMAVENIRIYGKNKPS